MTWHVYFIRSCRLIRIGMTENLKKRLAAHKNNNAAHVEFLGSIVFTDGNLAASVEARLLQKFHCYRDHGDWFEDNSDIAEVIRQANSQGFVLDDWLDRINAGRSSRYHVRHEMPQKKLRKPRVSKYQAPTDIERRDAAEAIGRILKPVQQ